MQTSFVNVYKTLCSDGTDLFPCQVQNGKALPLACQRNCVFMENNFEVIQELKQRDVFDI